MATTHHRLVQSERNRDCMIIATEQKIRECRDAIKKVIWNRVSINQSKEIDQILNRYFGQPEQPDKSLDELCNTALTEYLGKTFDDHIEAVEWLRKKFKQVCIEYAATKGAK